jgi:pimeloyl-ACP methyl ester carboxylesterase
MSPTTNQPAANGNYADVNEARLYYEVAGAGHPLVLLHAGVADSRMWDAQWTAFARHYTVIRYDRRGFGRSEMPPASFSYHEELRALGGYQWSDEMRRFGAEEDVALEQGDLAAASDLNVRTWVDGPHRPPGQVDPAIRELVREMQHRAFTLDSPDAELRPLEPPAAGRLAQVRAPTLVAVGDLDMGDMQAIADVLVHPLSSILHPHPQADSRATVV